MIYYFTNDKQIEADGATLTLVVSRRRLALLDFTASVAPPGGTNVNKLNLNVSSSSFSSHQLSSYI